MDLLGGSEPPATPPPPSNDRLNRLAGEVFTADYNGGNDPTLALSHKLDAVMAIVSKIDRGTNAGQGDMGSRNNGFASGATSMVRQEAFGRNISASFSAAQRRTSTSSSNLLNEGASSVLLKRIDETLPFSLGDLVVLRDLDSPMTRGFVTANCATNACGVQVNDDEEADPLNYEDFVFQVFPALSYRTMEEIENRKAAAASTGLKSKGSFKIVPNAATETKDEVSALMERANTEMRVNQAVIREVETGARRHAVSYKSCAHLN